MKNIDGVSRDELINKMSLLASDEASRRKLSDWETEDLESDSKYVISEIFDSLVYRKKTNKSSDFDYLDYWSHRTRSMQEDDWKLLGIDRGRIQQAVKIYLENEWMHNSKTDWLIVNVLNYAELIGFKESMKANLLSSAEYLEKKLDYLPEYKNAKQLRPIKNILWKLSSLLFVGLILYLVGFYFELPILAIVIGILLIIWEIFSRLRNAKVLRKIAEMNDELESTYDTCANLNMSWDLIWDSMIKSKEKMVVWDNLVFSLVETRRK